MLHAPTTENTTRESATNANNTSVAPAYVPVRETSPRVAQRPASGNHAGRQRYNSVAPLPLRPSQAPVLQRKCACGGSASASGTCSGCQEKQGNTLQRRAVGALAEPSVAPALVHDVLRSSGQPLNADTRAFMEPRFGQDFSHVRVHTDAKAAQSARAVNAMAYTVGNQIAFDAGQYQPQTADGKRLLAHELTHTVQQKGSGLPPANGIRLGASDSPEERQADSAAQQAFATNQESVALPTGNSAAILQRQDPPATPPAQNDPDPPTPLTVVQIPISPLNFQLPLLNSTVPGARGVPRSTYFDQGYQPNVAAGVVHSWRRNPGGQGWNLGFDLGGFAQFGGAFALSDRPTTGLMGTGSPRTLTGYNYQAYIQPAWIIFSVDIGGHRSFQVSAFAQLGGAYNVSDIPGLQGWGISGQIGPQAAVDIIPNLLQGVASTTLGYSIAVPSQPLPGDPSVQGSSFFAFNVGIAVILPWSYFPRAAPSPERTAPTAPRLPEPEPPTPQPQPPTNTPQPPVNTPPTDTPQPQPPTPAAAPSLPASVEIFFRLDHPRPGETGADLSVLTDAGRANLPALAQTLRDNPALRLLLIGSCSEEGDPAYNYALGQRRAEWLASQLGVDASRLTTPPEGELREECHVIRPGIASCGETGADTPPNPRDRRALVIFYNPPMP